MSNFYYQFNRKLFDDVDGILARVDVGEVPYICYYKPLQNKIVFDRRYDISWFMKHRHESMTSPSEAGLFGYIYVDKAADKFISFFVKADTCALVASSICNIFVWEAGEAKDILHCMVTNKITTPWREIQKTVDRVMTMLTGIDVKTSQQIVGMSCRVDTTLKDIILDSKNTTRAQGNRISLISDIGNKFKIYNEGNDINLLGGVDGSFVCVIEKGLDGEVDENLMLEICHLLSRVFCDFSPKVVSGRDSELQNLIDADPRVYYTGIARHCPTKPIPIAKFSPNEKNTSRQILYPKHQPVLYRAQPGYRIGLKINKVPPPTGFVGKPFPAFPCCFKTYEYKMDDIYKIYMNCSTDEEFKKRVDDKLKYTITTDIVPVGRTGVVYPPLNDSPHLKSCVRKRVVDWFKDLKCSFADMTEAEYNMCVKNATRLGAEDITTLRAYITEPIHDVRITYHMFEKRLQAKAEIFIKRNDKITKFVTQTKEKYNNKTFNVIIYENGRIMGYELIVNKPQHQERMLATE